MRVLVLGAAGMLGHKVFQVLRGRHLETRGTIRGRLSEVPTRHMPLLQTGTIVEDVDALDIASVEALLRQERPDAVVNCVGIIKQRSEAKAAVPSIKLNALLPHLLADTLQEWGGRLIHFSTDCVFSGRRGNYTEEDPSDAEDLYGRTKYMGEVATDNALTLRTSIIGRELQHFGSLLEWFLAQNHGRISGYRHAIYSGVTTNYLAGLVADLLVEHPQLSGMLQVASAPISKHDLLVLLREAYGLDVEITPEDAFFCDRSMRGDRFRQATGYICPSWPDLVAELAADPTPYDEWRPPHEALRR